MSDVNWDKVEQAETELQEIRDLKLGYGDRVQHDDGSTGTVKAFWVVWDDGDADWSAASVLKKIK